MARFQFLGFAALLTLFWTSGDAAAASFFFQAVAKAPASPCQPPCYEFRMFVEDPSRSLELQNLDLDLEITGATPVGLPFPPAPTQAAANTSLEDAEGNSLSNFPWQLANSVGISPALDFDVRLIDVAQLPFSIDSLQTTFDTYDAICDSTCTLHRQALAANRIFLGRFNLLWNGEGVGVRVGGIFRTGWSATDDPVDGLFRLNGSRFDVSGFPALAPEPASGALLSVFLLVLEFRRTAG
jgi:hypothetical protein